MLYDIRLRGLSSDSNGGLAVVVPEEEARQALAKLAGKV